MAEVKTRLLKNLSSYCRLKLVSFSLCHLKCAHHRRGYYVMTDLAADKKKRSMKEDLSEPPVKKTPKKYVEVPHNANLQVVQNGSPGTVPCLILRTTNKIYLFNCPEGTQRISNETTLFRLIKLEDIFFTQSTWDHCGGFPGLAMTVQGANELGVPGVKYPKSAGKPTITLHGLPYMSRIAEAIRPYTDESFDLLLNDDDSQSFSDEAMDVEFVRIYSENLTKSNPEYSRLKYPFNVDFENVASPNFANNLKRLKDFVQKLNTPDAFSIHRNCAVSYICRLKPGKRKIDMKKCMELGVKIGPLIGKLQKGESITLENGTVVTSEQVVLPPPRPGTFVVVDCPSEHFLKSFVENQNLAKCQKEPIDVVVHFPSKSVIETKEYKEWMSKFGSETNHLFLNASAPFYPHLRGAYGHQLLMNKFVHSDIFPLLPYHQHQTKDLLPLETENNGWRVDGEPFMKYDLRPHYGLSRDTVELDHCATLQSARESFDFESVGPLREALEKASFKLEVSQYPEIVFLGTCSSVPCKYRNVTGILLHLRGDMSCLLDCGEGTFSQMVNLYGPENIDNILINIKMVHVSHMHADHHLGLFLIAKRRIEAFQRAGKKYEPFYLLAPISLFLLQNFYICAIEDLGLFAHGVINRNTVAIEKMAKALNFKEISLVPVVHSQMPSGLIMVTEQGHKIVFSGDTRRSENLIEAGQNADLLIHEATFDDNMVEDAVTKKHSTTSEAIKVGRDMKAKFTMLTHFSTRYAKVPLITDVFDNNVGIAMDNMKFTLQHRPILPLLIPIQKSLYFMEHSDIERMVDKRNFRTANRKKEEKVEENAVGRIF